MYNKILGSLYIGDLQDAHLFRKEKPEGAIICVLEGRPSDEPMKAYHLPIMQSTPINESDAKVQTEQLDHIAFFLETLLEKKIDVLVHCAAGIERSPLTVAYYLAYSKGISIHEAYKIVKRGRPQAQDRTMWLKQSYEDATK